MGSDTSQQSNVGSPGRALLHVVGTGLLGVLILMVSACGILDRDSTPGSGSGADDLTSSEQPADDSSPDVVQQTPTTQSNDDYRAGLRSLEERWRAVRAENVRVVSASLTREREDGDAAGVVSALGDFDLDLEDCPAEWDDLAGVDDATIRLGLIVAQTGDRWPVKAVAEGFSAYVDSVNEAGGVDGRIIELVVEDDAFDAEITTTVAEELVADEEGLLAVATVGAQPSLAAMEIFNESCVPHPFSLTSHPGLGDPSDNPWSTGVQLAHSTEALLWGNWMKRNLVEELPVSVGLVMIDNQFGDTYGKTFEDWADSNADVVEELTVVRHDPVGEEFLEDMTELAGSAPDILVLATSGPACTQLLRDAAALGMTNRVAVIVSSTCKDVQQYMTPAGAAADNALMLDGTVKSTVNPRFQADPFVRRVAEILDEAGVDAANPLAGTGAGLLGWTFVETLRIASELPGGLTRSNFVVAQRTLDLEHPYLIDGMQFSTRGLDDAFLLEASELSRFDASERVWITEPIVVDINGGTPNCSWTTKGCS